MANLKRFVIPILIFLLLWSIYGLIFSGQGGLIKVLKMRKQLKELSMEIDSLKKQKEDLEEEISLLEKKDPEIIEKEARRLGMIKKGEEVIELEYDSLPDNVRD